MPSQLEIRSPETRDRAAWSRLYEGYAQFYLVSQTDEMRDRVWSWITDPTHEVCCLVAEHEGELVGLAHFRTFSRPLRRRWPAFWTISSLPLAREAAVGPRRLFARQSKRDV